MTSMVSWFNCGIYKNTLRRFMWGSVLYFIMLFFSVPFVILIQGRYYDVYSSYYSNILLSDLLYIALFTAIAVPTVVAMLVYRFVHAKKASLAITSMPVKREAVFISTVLGALTLMTVPVLVNAIILTVMRFIGFSYYIRLMDIALWTGVNLYVLFVMFSIATLSAFLTGSTAAVAVINLIIVIFPYIVYLVGDVIGNSFLKGYYGGWVLDKVLNLTPIQWISVALINSSEAEIPKFFADYKTWIYFAVAATVYIITMFIYKRRQTELCGDVAGFKIMNPILKYTVTGIAFICTLGILSDIGYFRLFAAAIIGVIVYFACEMILQKRVNIFMQSLKGLVCYAAIVTAILMFCGMTSFFGYETYVPEKTDVKCVAIDNMIYSRERDCYSRDEDIISGVCDIHRDIINSHDEYDENDYWNFDVEYILNNGKSVKRSYRLSEDKRNEYIGRLFENTDYKYCYTNIDQLNPENIKTVDVEICRTDNGEDTLTSSMVLVGDDAKKLINAVIEDMEDMTYEEFSKSDNSYERYDYYMIRIDDDYRDRVLKEDMVFKSYPHGYNSIGIFVNDNFKNTFKFLKEYEKTNAAD